MRKRRRGGRITGEWTTGGRSRARWGWRWLAGRAWTGAGTGSVGKRRHSAAWVVSQFEGNRVSPSLQCDGRPSRFNIADDVVVCSRSDGDGLLSEPVEEQASCF